ncbi:MAG: MerR family transcriptional regulator [Bacteroidota bacterium]|nr:MerR family transcriptional regulator [Candidatus Kapabacteria bacterium]MCS7302237.1 MerR family transcriptional regulator [Candidatus Kapabacteria bacterium]MCX7937767.1 MerR family transcriptional regulator [Chlorobiota bacterium]MDW8074857.1 MerR family transcriptional regulator [Bacteroidota bacterium]MDW8271496.1 MerR family transcriptional regulator [Bacteroidota bacterium]
MAKNSAVPKLYYSIREVCEMFDEQQHVLRHWEREFDLLRPNKNRAGNRVYTERDLRVLRVLKVLLREQHKTTAEVRQILANGIPESLEPIASDTSIEQRYAEKRRNAIRNTPLHSSEDAIVLSRKDAEALLATLRRLEELLGDNSQ